MKPELAGNENYTFKAKCRECGINTPYYVRANYEKTIHDEESAEHETHTYEVVECAVCNAISFKHELDSSVNYDPEYDDTFIITKIYPDPDEYKRSQQDKREPVKFTKLFPDNITRSYRETLKSFNNEMYLASALTLRALVESICISQGCRARSLNRKIDELVTKGILSQNEANFLHLLRFIGNEAAHEITPPPQDELEAAIDIVESLLKTIYELEQIAKSIDASRHSRISITPDERVEKQRFSFGGNEFLIRIGISDRVEDKEAVFVGIYDSSIAEVYKFRLAFRMVESSDLASRSKWSKQVLWSALVDKAFEKSKQVIMGTDVIPVDGCFIMQSSDYEGFFDTHR